MEPAVPLKGKEVMEQVRAGQSPPTTPVGPG